MTWGLMFVGFCILFIVGLLLLSGSGSSTWSTFWALVTLASSTIGLVWSGVVVLIFGFNEPMGSRNDS